MKFAVIHPDRLTCLRAAMRADRVAAQMVAERDYAGADHYYYRADDSRSLAMAIVYTGGNRGE